MSEGRRNTVVLTGGTSGVGWSTVDCLLTNGARVVSIGRDETKCAECETEMRARHIGADIKYFPADLSMTAEARRVGRRIIESVTAEDGGAIDAFVHSAAAVSTWRMVTDEGYELQFAVNHLAAFAMIRELLPVVNARTDSRIVLVGSRSHRGTRLNRRDPMLRRGYSGLRAYRQSKLANVLLAAEFNRRHLHRRVRAYVFDPGLVRTDIGLKHSGRLQRFVWRRRISSKRAASPDVPARFLAEFILAEELSAPTELYWRNGEPEPPDPAGLNPDTGAFLWELSERLCAAGERAQSHAVLDGPGYA